MSKLQSFLNQITRNAATYTPGEQVNEPGWIKLNTNESPLPASPAVFAEMKILATNPDLLRKYSSPDGEPLRSAIAEKFSLHTKDVLITNGSDEALALICRAVLEPHKTALMPAITYSLYKTLVKNVGASVQDIPMRSMDGQPYTIDLEALASSAGDLVFLPNPNAITGEFIHPEKLRTIIASSTKLWVVDEAYNDFAGINASMISQTQALLNLIVTRTFSKTHALAGLRVGYAVTANSQLMSGLNAHKDSYNEDALATRLATAALTDDAWHMQIVNTVLEERRWLKYEFTQLGFVVFDSSANFFLAREPADIQAESIYHELKKYKILVRYYANSPFSDCLRISVGSHEENVRLIEALSKILQR